MCLRGLFLGAFAFLLLLPLGSAYAEVTFEQMRQLPPLPAAYVDEPDATARIAWLQKQLAGTHTAAERLRLQRALTFEHVNAHQPAAAAALCQARPPLHEDIRHREACLNATLTQDDALVPQLLVLNCVN